MKYRVIENKRTGETVIGTFNRENAHQTMEDIFNIEDRDFYVGGNSDDSETYIAYGIPFMSVRIEKVYED